MEITMLNQLNRATLKQEVASKGNSRLLYNLGVLPVSPVGYYPADSEEIVSEFAEGSIPAYSPALLSSMILLSFQDLVSRGIYIPILNKIETKENLTYITFIQWGENDRSEYRSDNQADIYCQILCQLVAKGYFEVEGLNTVIYSILGFNSATDEQIISVLKDEVASGHTVHDVKNVQALLLEKKLLASSNTIKRAQEVVLKGQFSFIFTKEQARTIIPSLLAEGPKKYFLCHSKASGLVGVFASTSDRNECRKQFAKAAKIGYFDAGIKFLDSYVI